MGWALHWYGVTVRCIHKMNYSCSKKIYKSNLISSENRYQEASCCWCYPEPRGCAHMTLSDNLVYVCMYFTTFVYSSSPLFLGHTNQLVDHLKAKQIIDLCLFNWDIGDQMFLFIFPSSDFDCIWNMQFRMYCDNVIIIKNSNSRLIRPPLWKFYVSLNHNVYIDKQWYETYMGLMTHKRQLLIL